MATGRAGGRDRSVAAQVRELAVPRGHLAVWALGQQGYIFKAGEHVVQVGHRSGPAPEPRAAALATQDVDEQACLTVLLRGRPVA